MTGVAEHKRTIAIIQARMGANRLPGKVLLDIAGKPMLAWVVERAKLASKVDEVVVATTSEASDEAVAKFCETIDVHCFRGNLYDVLDRYYQAAKYYRADVVVRLTADCPLLDPGLIDLTIAELEQKQLDFAANRLPPPWKRTYPIGLDVEVVTFAALEKAWKEAKEPFEREHVLPYLYDAEGRFNISVLNAEKDHSTQRWTVDTPEDLEVMRRAYDHFSKIEKFGWKDVLKFFEQHPELGKINADVKHKSALDLDSRSGKH